MSQLGPAHGKNDFFPRTDVTVGHKRDGGTVATKHQCCSSWAHTPLKWMFNNLCEWDIYCNHNGVLKACDATIVCKANMAVSWAENE